jgi:hypothetical protein
MKKPTFSSYIGLLVILMVVFMGTLLLFEVQYRGWIVVKPHWYRQLRRLVPGVAESDQRNRMLVIITSMEMTGVVSTTPSNDFPPKYDFQDIDSDLWGTPFRFETTNGILTIRSAGPDKKLYTKDDRVYRN